MWDLYSHFTDMTSHSNTILCLFFIFHPKSSSLLPLPLITSVHLYVFSFCPEEDPLYLLPFFYFKLYLFTSFCSARPWCLIWFCAPKSLLSKNSIISKCQQTEKQVCVQLDDDAVIILLAMKVLSKPESMKN